MPLPPAKLISLSLLFLPCFSPILSSLPHPTPLLLLYSLFSLACINQLAFKDQLCLMHSQYLCPPSTFYIFSFFCGPLPTFTFEPPSASFAVISRQLSSRVFLYDPLPALSSPSTVQPLLSLPSLSPSLYPYLLPPKQVRTRQVSSASFPSPQLVAGSFHTIPISPSLNLFLSFAQKLNIS